MRDFTQRGNFVNTYWKEAGKAPSPTKWELYGVGLSPEGKDVLLAEGTSHADCLIAAQRKLAVEYKGRFI